MTNIIFLDNIRVNNNNNLINSYFMKATLFIMYYEFYFQLVDVRTIVKIFL